MRLFPMKCELDHVEGRAQDRFDQAGLLTTEGARARGRGEHELAMILDDAAVIARTLAETYRDEAIVLNSQIEGAAA